MPSILSVKNGENGSELNGKVVVDDTVVCPSKLTKPPLFNPTVVLQDPKLIGVGALQVIQVILMIGSVVIPV